MSAHLASFVSRCLEQGPLPRASRRPTPLSFLAVALCRCSKVTSSFVACAHSPLRLFVDEFDAPSFSQSQPAGGLAVTSCSRLASPTPPGQSCSSPWIGRRSCSKLLFSSSSVFKCSEYGGLVDIAKNSSGSYSRIYTKLLLPLTPLELVYLALTIRAALS